MNKENSYNNSSKNFKNNTKKKLKLKSLNIKNWGINFDKNEYQEIILSNSNHPEFF